MKGSRSEYVRTILAKHPDWTNKTVEDYCVRHGRDDINAALVATVRQHQKKLGKLQAAPTFEPTGSNISELVAVVKLAKAVGGVRRLKPIVDLLCSLRE